MSIEVKLPGGLAAVVDEGYSKVVGKLSWTVDKSSGRVVSGSGDSAVYLDELIANGPEGSAVWAVDGDPLNCMLNNLRLT